MAKFQLKAGAEVDFLTDEELGQRLDDLQAFFRDLTRGQEGETITRTGGPFKTDGSGDTAYLPRGGGGIYEVPVGFAAFLTRLSVDYEGSSAASPQTCDLRVVADQNTPSALRTIADVVPNVFDASKSHAPLFRGGQVVVVCLTGGPVSTSIYCTVQVVLTPTKALGTDTLSST